MPHITRSPYQPYNSNPPFRAQPRSGISARIATKGVEVVYYIALDSKTIKIGTSSNFLERIAKHGLPGLKDKSRVLAIEFGGFELEKQRHQEFADLRIVNTEQFRPGPSLLTHIKKLRASTNIGS